MSKKKPLGFVSVDHTEGDSAVTIRLNRVPTKSEFGYLTYIAKDAIEDMQMMAPATLRKYQID